MFKFIRKKLTKNLTEIPLFWMTFNYKHYKENGKKGSCTLNVHPNLANDTFIQRRLNDLIDYIRDNYNMEDF